MIKIIKQWFIISRGYALPMTIISWFVAFCFCITKSGNTIYGIIALIGLCLAHLGTNLFDDYIDFKILRKKINNNKTILLNAQKGKCGYIENGTITPLQTLVTALILFSLASLIGIFFTIKIGLGILIFMLLGGGIALIYPILGKFRLCEIGLSIVYGPLMFGGINYVMTNSFDWRIFIICLPSMFMTLNTLYTDIILDYEIDKKENKKTIANLFKSKWNSLNIQKGIIAAAYISIVFVAIIDISDWQIFLTFGTIPLAINLIDSMKIFIIDNNENPQRKFFEGPMENWNEIMEEGSTGFMLRMYQSRNLMICFSIIFAIALLFTA